VSGVLVPQVKICGVTRAADARTAVEAGADAIGVIFVPRSPRCVDERSAVEIRAAAENVTLVGVFADVPAEQIVALAERVGLDAIQLHGQETPDFGVELSGLLPGRVVLKALRFQDRVDFDRICPYAEAGIAVLVDGLFGGGPLDWSVLQGWREQLRVPLVLAGGLTPENVEDAVRMVWPSAVDVARGVERTGQPAVKDPDRVREFVRRVRSVARTDADVPLLFGAGPP